MKRGMARKRLLLIIIAVFIMVVGIVFVVTGLTVQNDKLIDGDYSIDENYKSSIEDYDPETSIEGYPGGKTAFYIKGKVTANKDKDFSVITFNLYDKRGKRIGTAVAALKKMKKDQKYDFKALGLVKETEINNIDHYSLKSIEEK